MKTKTILPVLAIVAWGFFPAGASEPIESAYGKRLGDSFDPKEAIGQSTLPDGIPMYQFKASKQSDFFNAFYVLITPQTKRIYSIYAVSAVMDADKIRAAEKDLIDRLRKKYGESRNEGAIVYPMPDVIRFDHGNRDIVVKAYKQKQGDGYSLDITYLDRELEKTAERERREIAKEKGDSL